MLFDIANLTYWIFLAIGIVFFLTVIISGAEDQDFDTDADMDFDIDAVSEVRLRFIANNSTSGASRSEEHT